MSYAEIRSTAIGAVLAFSLLTIAGSYSGPALAQQANASVLNPSHPDSYVVQPGDTLWDIAGMFLRDPWYWPEIWQVNPQIENPHLIFPGDVLSLAYLDDGSPVIQLSRGGAAAQAGPTRRLSPRVRREPLEEAIPTIPFDAIRAFLNRPAVLDPGELSQLPYIFANREGLLGSAGRDVYVRGTDAEVGTVFNVVNQGDPIVDPDDDTILGYQGLFVGQGRVTRAGDPATVYLSESAREAKIGDFLIGEENVSPITFFPSAPRETVEGRIISVLDGLFMIGQYQIVLVNLGARDGIEPGNVLSVYQTGETVVDRTRDSGFFAENVRLPDELAGNMMVFRVSDRMSYAIVMESTREMRVLDTVRNPDS
jgi:hypothetical protein